MTARKMFWAGAAFLLAYFLFFTWKGLRFPFDNDDMYSIYMGWTKPWSEMLTGLVEFWRTSFRPAGLLLYRAIFEIFGFRPLPFRIVCLVIAAGNVALCYWFVSLISESGRTAALAALLFTFQSRLMEIWFRTATVYDILCFTFFYLGLCVYIAGRRRAQALGPSRSIAVLLCYLAALDSKEMAVAFPAVLFAWEVIFHGISVQLRRYWLILVTGAIAALFILTKMHGGAASMADPAFTPSYTLQRFQQNWNGMLTHLFLLTKELRGAACIAILGCVLASAALFRSRRLVFAWILLFVAAMPFVFIPPRGGYVLYIPYVGWVLFAAVTLTKMQDLVLRRWPAIRLRLAVFVFLLVAWRWGKANLHDQRIDPVKPWLYSSPRAIEELVHQVAGPHPQLAHHRSVLFLNDGFGTDEWTPLFVLRLFFRDPELRADRMKMLDRRPSDWTAYDYVFDYAGGRYTQRKP